MYSEIHEQVFLVQQFSNNRIVSVYLCISLVSDATLRNSAA